MGKARALQFVELETGCFVPLSHKPNQDGYFRKTWGNARSGDRHAEFFHRVIWKLKHGEIPKDHEIDHKCRNRFCCNVDHLQLMSRKEHTVKTNQERYAERKAKAFEHWSATKCSGIRLSDFFKVSFSTACKWIREWKGSETISKESRNDMESSEKPHTV